MTFANMRRSAKQNSDDLRDGCALFLWIFLGGGSAITIGVVVGVLMGWIK